MSTELTWRTVFNRLADQGRPLPDDPEALLAGLPPAQQKSGTPWYVRFFTGLTAWIGALFFIGFLAAADIITGEIDSVIAGLFFCAIAVGLNYAAPQNDFWVQLGLALSLAGQVLFLFGINELLNFAVVPVALVLIILELILLIVYRSWVHRLISTMAILGALLSIVNDLQLFELLNLFTFGLAAVITFICRFESKLLTLGLEEASQPILYAMTAFLLGLLVAPLYEWLVVSWWITAVLLTAVLLFILVQIAHDLNLPLRQGIVPWLALGCLLLLIPAVRAPGLPGAIILLILGFWRSKRVLLGLAAAGLLFYLSSYYYSLEWTLLVKSLVLMGTGILLLGMRGGLLKLMGNNGTTPLDLDEELQV